MKQLIAMNWCFEASGVSCLQDLSLALLNDVAKKSVLVNVSDRNNVNI